MPSLHPENTSLTVGADLFSESGCSWEEEEFTVALCSHGSFDIAYIEDFEIAVSEWVSEHESTLEHDCTYSLVMSHVYEHDGGGALMDRYFKVDKVYMQRW